MRQYIIGFLFAIIFLGILGPGGSLFLSQITGRDESFVTDVKRYDSENRLLVQSLLDDSVTIPTVPGGIGDMYYEFAKNGSNENQVVDGSSTPVVFSLDADPVDSIFICQIKCFVETSSGQMQFGKYLTANAALTNGVSISIKSDNNLFTFPDIKTTQDWKNFFVFRNMSNFRLDLETNNDQMVASFEPKVLLVLKKQGTFGAGNDDYVNVKIQDNLTLGSMNLESQRCIGFGYTKAE